MARSPFPSWPGAGSVSPARACVAPDHNDTVAIRALLPARTSRRDGPTSAITAMARSRAIHAHGISSHETLVRVWPFRAGLGVGAREGRGAGDALSWWVPAKSRHHAFPTVPFRRGHPNLRAV